MRHYAKHCVLYIRKDGGKMGKTVLADRWYCCDHITGSNKMNTQFIVEGKEQDHKVHNLVKTAVSDEGKEGVIFFYEAE